MPKFSDVTISYADSCLNLALDTLEKQRQALVFCNTKRGAESQAEKIAQKVKNPPDAEELERIAQGILDAVQSPTKQCMRLAACIRKGTAFHHSGLNAKQRELVETNFRSGIIKIISATPTLAMGMDLPAYRSIIRDLKRYSSGTSWGMADIPVLEYEQMCVTGDTRIKTSIGDIPIKDIVASDEELKILSYDTATQTYSYQPILLRFHRKASGFLALETRRGYPLKITGNHPLYVRRGGICMWLPAEQVKPGDELLISSVSAHSQMKISLQIPGETYFPQGQPLMQQVKSETGWGSGRIGAAIATDKRSVYHYTQGAKALPLEKGLVLHDLLQHPGEKPVYFDVLKSRYGTPVFMQSLFTEEFFWLAGMIASDGTLTTTTDKRSGSRYVRIKVGSTNEEIISKAKYVLGTVTGGKVHYSRREDGFMQVELGCTLLADILRDNFGIPHGKKSSTITAPALLFTAPREFVGAYLSGVFDGDGSYLPGHRIHFSTGSREFAYGLQQLLLRIGIISSVAKERAGQVNIIRGKIARFSEGAYAVKITKKSSIMRFAELAKPVKCEIAEVYSHYHNIDVFHGVQKASEWIAVRSVENLSHEVDVYNIGVAQNNNYFANGILAHNCGRAGRPGKESIGEAICIAESEGEKERIIEKYLLGDPEDIYSKLAVEPVLRTYVLSLIASGYVHDTDSLYAFFDQTFYAFQYEDTGKLHAILDKMIMLLAQWGFIEAPASIQDDFAVASELAGGALSATKLGERVAQLYLDPYTAHHLLDAIANGEKRGLKFTEFSLLHLLTTTLEMRPLLNIRQAELDAIDRKLLEEEEHLFVKGPSIYSHEYEEFLQTIKTATFLQAWVNETGEDVLFAEYNATPGEIQGKRDRSDWLLYSLIELAKLMKWHGLIVEFEKMRMRLEYGAKEEVLPLLRLKGIGRVRARKLFHNSIRSIDAVKQTEFSTLKSLIGEAIAISIKEQVGQKVTAEDLTVKRNKRKGQISLGDYGEEKKEK